MKNVLIRIAFLSLSLFFAIQLNAQEEDSLKFEYRPIVALKFAPFSLIDYTPTILFGVEVGTFSNQSFQLEYGWVTDLYNSTQSGFDGFKLKTEYRFYFPKKIKVLYNGFLGPQFIWKEVSTQGLATAWRYNQSYQEIIPVRVNNQVFSYYITGGFVFRLFGSFCFETNTSIGYRRLTVSIKDIPDDAVITGGVGGGFFNPVRGEGTYNLVGVNFSAKIIFIIK